MAKIMCCPFFEREIKKNGAPIGIKCKCATIRFPSKSARREFVYPLCGDVKGYDKCPIYRFLEKDGCK